MSVVIYLCISVWHIYDHHALLYKHVKSGTFNWFNILKLVKTITIHYYRLPIIIL